MTTNPLAGLYVVRTPFKAGGDFYQPGLLLSEEDLLAIKLVKIRLNEKKIIPLPTTKEEMVNLCDYMEVRMGVNLREKLAERVSKGSGSAEPQKTNASTPPPGTKPAEKPQPLSKGTTNKPKPSGK